MHSHTFLLRGWPSTRTHALVCSTTKLHSMAIIRVHRRRNTVLAPCHQSHSMHLALTHVPAAWLAKHTCARTEFGFRLPDAVWREGFPRAVGVKFTEKAIMLCKACVFNDREAFDAIRAAPRPSTVKRCVRACGRYAQLAILYVCLYAIGGRSETHITKAINSGHVHACVCAYSLTHSLTHSLIVASPVIRPDDTVYRTEW